MLSHKNTTVNHTRQNITNGHVHVFQRNNKVEEVAHLHHGPVSDKVRPEIGDVFGEITDISNKRSLEAYLGLAELVRSAFGLNISFVGCHAVRRKRRGLCSSA